MTHDQVLGCLLGGATLGALRALDSTDHVARRTARDVCRITHHSDEAWIAALALWRAIEEALAGRLSAPGYLGRVAHGLPDALTRDALLRRVDAPGLSLEDLAREIGTSGHAPESVTLAIAAAPRALGDFEGVMTRLVGLGGDADTIASMCGQVAGAALGAARLPGRWVDELRPWVEPAFAGFAASVQAPSRPR